MKLTTLMALIAAIFICSHPAFARGTHGRHGVRHRIARRAQPAQEQQSLFGLFASASPPGDFGGNWTPNFATPFTRSAGGRVRRGGRPAAWCGWQMRQLVGSDPGPTYNLARNWAHWGHAGPAGVGAVVVWPHHVGKIVGQENGQWVIQSGNDGHALRTRVRSVAGAIAFRWG